jgi:hypothetical protein
MPNIEQLLALVVCIACLVGAVYFLRSFLVCLGLVALGLAAWVAAGGVDKISQLIGG